MSHKHTHKCPGKVFGRTPEQEGSVGIQFPWDRFHYLVLFTFMGVIYGMQEMGSFVLSMGQCEQKEVRSAGQWFLRGEPQT